MTGTPSTRLEDYSSDCSRLKEALYSLGQIASSDTGYQAVEKAAHDVRRQKLRERRMTRQRAHEEAQALVSLPPPSPLATIQSGVAADAEIAGVVGVGVSEGTPPLSSSSKDSSDILNASADSGSSCGSPLASPHRDISPGSHRIPSVPPPRDLTPEQAQAEQARRESEWTRQDEIAEPLFNFLDWCTRYVCEHPHYGVRTAIFNVLGLVSRSPMGKHELIRRKWDSSPTGGSSAVAIPQNHSQLFRRNGEEEARFSAFARSVQAPRSLSSLSRVKSTPSMRTSGALEVLYAISNMQGFLFSTTENKVRLEQLKRERPQAFQHRDTYLAVQELLESAAFRLADRREISGLFPSHVKLKYTS